MKKTLYLIITLFITFSFLGCSDSYDQALEPTVSEIDIVEAAVDDVEKIAEDNNVTLSENTETKINDLREDLLQIKVDSAEVDNSGSSVAITEAINNTFEMIGSLKTDILDSNITDAEKEKAIDEIEIIEREKLQEGLNAYTTNIQNNNDMNISEECKEADNLGTLPPMLPVESDNCN